MLPTITPDPDESKLCPHCGRVLPLDAFNKHKYGSSGRRSWCRECEARARPRRRRRVSDGLRWCPECERELEPSSFGRNRARGGGGLRAWCRECESARRRSSRSKASVLRVADRQALAQLVLETGLKTCSRCSEEQPLSSFRPRKDSLDGLRGLCRSCERAKSREPDDEDRARWDRWQKNEAEFERMVERVRRELVNDGIVEE